MRKIRLPFYHAFNSDMLLILTQNMLRTHEVKFLFLREKIRFVTTLDFLTCQPVSE